jgi:Core-2/I-Branching enzyme
MALAFHVLAHKQPTQVARLIRAILRPEHVLVLHFDRRAPESLLSLGRELASAHPNVILQRPREVIWFGWQGLHTQIEAMSLALKAPQPWTHFITLSGADFPLQPIEVTAAQLAEVPTKSFLTSADAAGLWGDAGQRIERYHLASPLLLRVLGIPFLGRKIKAICGWTNHALPWIPRWRRRYPDKWPYLGGSNWCMLARPACEWLTTDPEARSFARWIRHVGNPDEMYFQSTLSSDRYKGPIENRSGHFIEFSPNAASPRVFTHHDLDRLLGSGAPFARKFDETVDAKILDQLEQRVLAGK